ncbi:hypothetical protein XF24_00343 [candidate division SR1 bacterium Aalborg_AAW-1]|nr:hypothetical protein XF24_00343 [candidate division SR1 bacterium Aalborg_AAW-1]
MILNLGAERIILIVGDQQIILPFEQVEEHLTQQVVELYMEYRPTALYVINGPGSFTNLRVGALIANLMGSLSKGTLQLMTIDKISLFRYLYLQGILPISGYIYFGQRKNFRISHLENDDYSTYSKQNFADTEAVRPDFFVDWFVGGDFPFFTERSQEITIVFEEGRIMISYQDSRLDCTDIFLPVQKIDPIYGIEPNIG